MTKAWPLVLAACAPAPALVADVKLPEVRAVRRSELVLRCTPSDAEVSLDGVPQGTCADFAGAPGSLGLGSGTRRVVVKKHGFEAWERWMDGDRTRVVMEVTLVPSGGSTP